MSPEFTILLFCLGAVAIFLFVCICYYFIKRALDQEVYTSESHDNDNHLLDSKIKLDRISNQNGKGHMY